MLGMEQMYKMALDPRIFPDSRLLAVLQGKDNSLPMAVAMSAKQQRDKLHAAGQGQQGQMGAKQPTVRDQMLARDLPPEQAGIDQLPAPTMESMGEPAMGAAGGLVSFASGGFNGLDDNEELSDQEELDSLMARQGDLGGLGAGIMAVANPQAPAYSSFTKPGSSATTTSGNFKDIAAEAAKKHGATLSLVHHVMHKETGGHKDPANAVSKAGATGVMQLMPKTAKELGVTNINDPHENINAGVRYIAQLEHKYKDPKLAAMAYNWGPGNVDRWLKRGKKESAVPKETRMYVASLAQGGIVSLAGGSKKAISDKDYDTSSEADDAMFGQMDNERAPEYISGLPGYLKRKLGPVLSGIREQINTGKVTPGATWNPALQAPATPPVVTKPAAAPASEPPPLSYDDAKKLEVQQAGPTRAEGATSFPPSASQTYLDKYMANLEQSRKQAPGLALMAAGLGIAGQRSPYGLSNVGAGGLQGLQSYVDMQKANMAGEAQGLSAQAALERNKVYQQHYATAAQQAQDAKYAGIISNLDKVAEERIKNMTKFGNFNLNDPVQRQKAIDQIKNNMIFSNPSLRKYYMENTGMSEKDLYNMANPSLLSDTPTGTVRKPT
jgi:hypothetical protein